MSLEIQREFLSANWQYWSNLRGIKTASLFCFRFRKQGGFLGEGKIILEVSPWGKNRNFIGMYLRGQRLLFLLPMSDIPVATLSASVQLQKNIRDTQTYRANRRQQRNVTKVNRVGALPTVSTYINKQQSTAI